MKINMKIQFYLYVFYGTLHRHSRIGAASISKLSFCFPTDDFNVTHNSRTQQFITK